MTASPNSPAFAGAGSAALFGDFGDAPFHGYTLHGYIHLLFFFDIE